MQIHPRLGCQHEKYIDIFVLACVHLNLRTTVHICPCAQRLFRLTRELVSADRNRCKVTELFIDNALRRVTQ